MLTHSILTSPAKEEPSRKEVWAQDGLGLRELQLVLLIPTVMGSIKPERGYEGEGNRTKMITCTEKHLQSHWVRGQGNHVTNFKITVSMRDV